MKRPRKLRCPLITHYAAGGASCIGCGKPFQAKPAKNPRKRNPPATAKRIGRVRKIFYDRDQGNRQGLYYHTFTRKGAGLWTEVNAKTGQKRAVIR